MEKVKYIHINYMYQRLIYLNINFDFSLFLYQFFFRKAGLKKNN